jgi:hypothetical protein
MIPLFALVTVIHTRAADAERHHILTELALLVVRKNVLLLAFTACCITLAGEAMLNEEVAILAFILINIVITLTCKANICA